MGVEFRLKKYISSSPKETEIIGSSLAEKLKGNEVIAIFGGMGAGKTAFTRGLASGLGVTDGVSSPTFALVHEYEGKFPIFHFDMYRVTNYDDLYSTGFFDYIENGIIVIEWSENIEEAIPKDAIRISINPISETEREITVSGVEI